MRSIVFTKKVYRTLLYRKKGKNIFSSGLNCPVLTFWRKLKQQDLSDTIHLTGLPDFLPKK